MSRRTLCILHQLEYWCLVAPNRRRLSNLFHIAVAILVRPSRISDQCHLERFWRLSLRMRLLWIQNCSIRHQFNTSNRVLSSITWTRNTRFRRAFCFFFNNAGWSRPTNHFYILELVLFSQSSNVNGHRLSCSAWPFPSLNMFYVYSQKSISTIRISNLSLLDSVENMKIISNKSTGNVTAYHSILSFLLRIFNRKKLFVFLPSETVTVWLSRNEIVNESIFSHSHHHNRQQINIHRRLTLDWFWSLTVVLNNRFLSILAKPRTRQQINIFGHRT